MPIIESSILVNRPARETYSFLKDLETFPKFIAGVEQIKLRQASKHQVVSEWTVLVDGTRISWREKDVFDDDLLSIKFKMLDGDFSTYNGEWRVLENGATSRISLAVSFDWGILSVREEVAKAVERKAQLAVRWMLRHLKNRLGHGTVLSQEAGLADPRSIVSELVTYDNEEGQRIVGYYDHLKEAGTGDPFVVIPPGYGETKRDALSVAYYLVKNGFNVIRYDGTDHVGESDGEIVNTTLGRFKGDLVATLDYLERTFGARRVGVVASSLAKRAAIKAAAEDKRIALLIGLMGVVDLRETLRAVYREDMIASCLAGKRWGVTDVLGFEVSGRFLETAIAERYHDLETTKEDMRKLDIPVVFLVAENDAWVRLADVRVVLESTRRPLSEMVVIPETLHHLEENPKAARVALRQIVASCSKYLRYQPIGIDAVVEPSVREIAVQNRVEKERLRRLRAITRTEERSFWEEYLGRYFVLIKSPDYRKYLEDVCDALRPFQDGDALLDAGCGNGHLGAWLLAQRKGCGGRVSDERVDARYEYVGVDFAESALKEARRRHEELLARDSSPTRPRYRYLLGDLQNALPLAEGSFTKICCSLVLSYLDDPLDALRKLMRLLRPGGRIVVTSLKPHNDLSLIYRNFVDVAGSEEEIKEARKLLSNAGRIRQKEGEGRYQFFSKTELMAMLATVGARAIEGRLSFGNQACVAGGEKAFK